MIRPRLLTFAAAALLPLAGAAQAHPHLLSSTPAEGASTAPTNRIELHFSEPLVLRFTGADLTQTSMMMNGRMTNMQMRVGALTTALAPNDPKTLVLTAHANLSPGAYRLQWHAVSTDTHRVTGALTFTVH
jgi:methionine-rich copper-binding protein CopC